MPASVRNDKEGPTWEGEGVMQREVNLAEAQGSHLRLEEAHWPKRPDSV